MNHIILCKTCSRRHVYCCCHWCRIVQLRPEVFLSAPVHYVASSWKRRERFQSNLHLHLCLAMPGFMPSSSSDSLSKRLTSVAEVIEGLDLQLGQLVNIISWSMERCASKERSLGSAETQSNNRMVNVLFFAYSFSSLFLKDLLGWLKLYGKIQIVTQIVISLSSP